MDRTTLTRKLRPVLDQGFAARVAALHDWLDRVTPVFHAPTAEE